MNARSEEALWLSSRSVVVSGSIAARVLGVGALSLMLLAIALIVATKTSVEGTVYDQIDVVNRVELGQSVLWQRTRDRGPATINAAGDLQFGSFVVNSDSTIVDKVKALTGSDASIFVVRNVVPIRVSTTIKLRSNNRTS